MARRVRLLGRLAGLLPVYVFLYLPLAVLVALSFNASRFMTSWQGFTFKWYAKLAANPMLVAAAWHSVLVAVLAATLATVLGTMTAYALYRYRFSGRALMRAGLGVVMLQPDIVMGVSLLMLFILLGMTPGFLTLLLAHVTFCLPFAAVTVGARLKALDPNLIEAAKDLGAGEYRAFRHVILPNAVAAVAAGWLLSFTLSMDDVIISFFVTGPQFEILPLRIYSMVRMGVKPDVNALSAIMIGVTAILVLASQFLLRRRK